MIVLETDVNTYLTNLKVDELVPYPLPCFLYPHSA